MDNKLKLISDSFGKDRVKLNEPLALHTGLKVGGPASLFYIAFSTNELIKMISYCRQLKLPFFVFGTGSKIMISDQGFKGVVIKNRTRNIKVVSIKGKVSRFGIGVDSALVEVESGLSMASFVEYLDQQNLLSGEFVGIPGSIGGNLFLNQALQNRVESIKVLNQESKVEKISSKDLSLKRHIVISAVLKIKSKH